MRWGIQSPFIHIHYTMLWEICHLLNRRFLKIGKPDIVHVEQKRILLAPEGKYNLNHPQVLCRIRRLQLYQTTKISRIIIINVIYYNDDPESHDPDQNDSQSML